MSDITATAENSYNKFSLYPLISANCVNYLIANNDSIFRILYYNDSDAWREDSNHPNLTHTQKINLIYAGQPDETKYRIFLDFGIDNPWTTQATLIRISPTSLLPSNHIVGKIVVAFEVYAHFSLDHLSNYVTRIDYVTQQFLEVFNGAEIGGLGRLFFDSRATNSCKTILTGKIPFKGKVTFFANWIV
jgi:hypothetical protein